MLRSLLSYTRLVRAYVGLNLRAQLEYRGAFLSQVGAMFLNDLAWVAFWVIFFTRFPVLRGWTIDDVITIWAISATGFGLAHALFGNALPLATIIARGQLDAWMLYPRALLPHLILGKMNVTAWGDMLFGLTVYLVAIQPDPARLALFLLLAIAVAILFLGFSIMTGSLSFYLGDASVLARQWLGAMITFSTYPAVLFDGVIRWLLYSLIPAAFVSYLPVRALRTLSLPEAALTVAGALAFLAIGSALFYLGLRRYESGNLMEMRG